MQTIKVIRSFNKTPQGGLAEVGETFDVEPVRAQELARLGLAELAGGAKAAPAPENKQAPAPENKAAPTAITSDGIRAAARQERAAAETVAREGRPAGSTRAPRKVAR